MGKNQRKPHKQGRNTNRSGKAGSSSPEVVVVVGDLTPPPPKGLVPASLRAIDSFDKPETIEFARLNYQARMRALIAAAEEYRVARRVSLTRASMSQIEAATLLGFINYDVAKGHPGDGKMRMDQVCVVWAGKDMWTSAAGKHADEIAAGTVLFDTYLLAMDVTRDGLRLKPHVEFVRLCGGNLDVARELCELHRDVLLAAVALNAVARGSDANVVSFGEHAEAYVAKQLAPTGFVNVVGRFPHPEAILMVTGDLAAAIEDGHTPVTVCTKVDKYGTADVTCEKCALLFGHVIKVSFHMNLYLGNKEALEVISALRSQKTRDMWKHMSDEDYEARCDAISASWLGLSAEERTARAGWAVSPEDRAARGDAIAAGLLDYYATLSPEDRAARCDAISTGVAASWLGLSAEERTARAGWTVSPEDRAARCDAMRKPKSAAAKLNMKKSDAAKAKISASMKVSMIGNTNNTRPDTKHLPCPNPACAYQASFSQKKRDFTKHFAACSECANFVRKTIDAKDPRGVLWGWKPGSTSKWPKWLPPQK